MIRNSKQDWSIGSTVRVGFVSLRVVAIEPTPGDGRPDAYLLESAKGEQYRFVPHCGLSKADAPIRRF